MSCIPEPAIQSFDIGQRIPFLTQLSIDCNTMSNTKLIGEFGIPRRPRTSSWFCVKARLMGSFLTKKTNKHEKTAAELPKKRKI